MKTMQNVNSKSTTTSATKIIKKIAVYMRVSTEKQNKNTSKETQLNAIDDYCKSNNLSYVPRVIYEDSESASRNPKGINIDDEKLTSRPGMNQLLFDARHNKFDAIIAYSHDRITRNVHESLLLKFLFEKLKIEVIYCRTGEKLNSQNQKFNDFFENLLNNLSQLESSLISSRAKLGNEANIKHGYWAGGPPPYGYNLETIFVKNKKSSLRINYNEARIVRDIFELYNQAYVPKEIAAIIKKQHEDNHDRKWTTNTIKGIIKNKEYTGVLEWDKKGGIRNPIKHKETLIYNLGNDYKIIDSAEWNNSEKIRALQKNKPRNLSTPFLLKGFLVCTICGEPMIGKNNGKGNGRGRMYYCPENHGKRGSGINAALIDKKVINIVGEILTSLIAKDEFNRFYDRYLEKYKNKRDFIRKQLNEVIQLIQENQSQLTLCKDEINNLKLSIVGEDTVQFEKQIKFLENLNDFYAYLSISENILKKQKIELDNEHEKKLIDYETLKKLLNIKKNVFDDILKDTSDERLYQRNMRILFFDIIEKISLSDNVNEIEIIFK